MNESIKEYPFLNNDKVILKKMTEADAKRLAEITSQKSVYATLPTFLFELRRCLRTMRSHHEIILNAYSALRMRRPYRAGRCSVHT